MLTFFLGVTIAKAKAVTERNTGDGFLLCPNEERELTKLAACVVLAQRPAYCCCGCSVLGLAAS